jgi:hypothetical protein
MCPVANLAACVHDDDLAAADAVPEHSVNR